MQGSLPKGNTPHVRPGGGFNQQLGSFDDEHLEANSMQQAMQQHTTTQAASTPTPDPSQLPAGLPEGMSPDGTPAAPDPKSNRSVGNVFDELKYAATDIVGGLKSLFNLPQALGIEVPDDPQAKAKAKQINQKFSQLTEAEQQVAQAKYQEKVKKKQMEEQQKAQEAKQKQAAKQQPRVAPSGSKKGPVGPGGTGAKQRAKNQLEQDRQRQDKTSSAG
jgi:hypothetical protein